MAHLTKSLAAAAGILLCLGLTSCKPASGDPATELSLHFERFMNAVLHSSQGDAEAARQVADNAADIDALLDAVTHGGQYKNCTYAAAPQAMQTALGGLLQNWQAFQHGSEAIQRNHELMWHFADAANTIHQNEPRLLELAEQSAAHVVIEGGSPVNITASAQLEMLVERFDKSAIRILLEPRINPEVAFLLGKDSNQIHDITQALLNGSSVLRTTPVKGAAHGTLSDFEKVFDSDIEAKDIILNNLQQELLVKTSIAELDARSGTFAKQLQALAGNLPAPQECH